MLCETQKAIGKKTKKIFLKHSTTTSENQKQKHIYVRNRHGLSEIDTAIANIQKWSKPKHASGTLSIVSIKNYIFTMNLYGVVLIVAPWNYPFNLLTLPFGRSYRSRKLCCNKMFQKQSGII